MDIDAVSDAVEQNSEGDKSHARLNTMVAIAVALLATFLGLCSVKDDNIVQGMQAAQAKSVDDWAWYQARKTREEFATATRDEMQALSQTAPATQRAVFVTMAGKYAVIAATEKKKEAQTQSDAEGDQKTYDALNYRDDQFDATSAAVSLAIALLAITALTRNRWLFWVAMVPSAFGLLMGTAGLLGWHIHSDLMARLLS